MNGRVISHYRVLDLIGSGGMGSVYLAEDLDLNRRVALKFITDERIHRPSAREQLMREAIAASQLDHPNIVTIHEFVKDEGEWFIAMSYVEGASLRELLDTKRMDRHEALAIVIGLLQGLEAAHRKGIIHLDIKPGNILVTREGVPKIADFGLARGLVQQPEGQALSYASTPYMAPELVWGDPVDQRADFFSVGVILYEILYGEMPFSGSNADSLLLSIVSDVPEKLAAPATETDEDFRHVIRRCLQKDPKDRYSSVADLMFDLKLAIEHSGERPVALHARSRRSLRMAFVVSGVLLLAALWTYFANRGTNAVDPTVAQGRLGMLRLRNAGRPDKADFVEGLTQELMGRLAAVPDLKVVADTLSTPVATSHLPIRELGEELDVDQILYGTVTWIGDSTDVYPHISLSLVACKTDKLLHVAGEKRSDRLDVEGPGVDDRGFRI